MYHSVHLEAREQFAQYIIIVILTITTLVLYEFYHKNQEPILLHLHLIRSSAATLGARSPRIYRRQGLGPAHVSVLVIIQPWGLLGNDHPRKQVGTF